MSLTAHPRRRLRRLRRTLGYGLALLVILAGLCVATLSQLLPLLSRDPQALADWLSERAGRPITLDAVTARWTRAGPLFDLEGLGVGSGPERLRIARAALQLDVYAGLLPGRPFSSLRLDGLSLVLARDAAGRWHFEGLGEGGGGLAQLEGLGELVVEGARLGVVDEASDRRRQLPRFDARLRSEGGLFRFAARAYPDDRSPPLRVSGELAADGSRGRLHLAADELQLAPWTAGVDVAGVTLLAGALDGEAWIDIAAGAVSGIEFAFAPRQWQLGEVDGAATRPFDLPALRGRFARAGDGWTLGFDGDDAAAPWLRLDWREEARRLAAGGVALETLHDLWPPGRMPEALAAWLAEALPRGQLVDLRAHWRGDELVDLEAWLQGVAIEPVGKAPGFHGLGLRGRWRDGALALTLDSAGLVIAWPLQLRADLPAALAGEVRVWRDEDIWEVASESLAVRGVDFAFDVAGTLRFDGGRPSTDLRVEVFESPIIAAKHFWMRGSMSPQSVAWLDDALVDGRLAGGHLLLRGDLDDWPFAGREGRFLAEAVVEDVTLRYRPDWPLATRLGGRAVFLDRSMEVEVSAEVLGNRVERAFGSIAEMGQPRLRIDVSGGGSGPGLLDLLRRSPLHSTLGQHLDALEIGGLAEVALDLDIPLKRELGEFAMIGSARLSESDLRDSRWGIALDAAEGGLRFSERGFAADGLAVMYSGQPARLDLRIGSMAADPAHALEAQLVGRLDANTLLDSQSGLAWLKPLMRGTSEWRIDVDVPTGGGPARLAVASDLVGTELLLPSPLRKAAAVRMPLALEIDLAGEAATEGSALELRLGELLRLHGRLGEDARFDGVAEFGASPGAERPARGLRVVGQVPVLDASAWAGLAASSREGDAGIVDIDLLAGELDLLDRSFGETRLVLERPEPGAMRLRFEGAALQGEVDLPPAAQRAERGVTARFERLRWPRPRKPDPGGLIDPASVPPIHLWVKSLTLGDAELGETRLETFPQATGMRVDLFESRSEAVQLFGRGEWTKVEGRERSSFELEFTAPDIGKMLRALGFDELVEGGQTLARLRATWPGAPAAFAMERVDGGLELSVGQGSVPQVSPGAGRLLGLFSLSEIPRRLALDFSDFFRAGLAFNRIAGSFVFDAGNAYTDDLVIESPAAEIRIRGRTGLEAQDYAQTMEVLPRTSSVLPVVGALAGGPAGAAIGAVAQAVLQQPLRQVNRTLYRVEGPWSKPVLEVLERGPSRPEGEGGRGTPGD